MIPTSGKHGEDVRSLTAEYWGYIVTDEECRRAYIDMCDRTGIAPGVLSPAAILINPEPLDAVTLSGLMSLVQTDMDMQ